MVARWCLVILATVALVGVAVGFAASLSVGGVDSLGSGTANVVAPTGVQVTDLLWFVDNKTPTRVGRVDITFAAVGTGDCLPGDGCTAHFALKDSTGGVLVGADGDLAQLTVSPFELRADDTEVVRWKLKGNRVLRVDIDLFAATVVDTD